MSESKIYLAGTPCFTPLIKSAADTPKAFASRQPPRLLTYAPSRLAASRSLIARLVFHRRFEDLELARFIEPEQNSARCACRMAGAIDRAIDGYNQRTIFVPLLRRLPIIARDMWMFFARLDPRRNFHRQIEGPHVLELIAFKKINRHVLVW